MSNLRIPVALMAVFLGTVSGYFCLTWSDSPLVVFLVIQLVLMGFLSGGFSVLALLWPVLFGHETLDTLDTRDRDRG